VNPQNPRSDPVPRGYKARFTLPEETQEKLDAYVALVRRWAPRLDLVAPGDLDRLGPRHIEDSLRALPLVESLPDGPAVDVGSGAGLPGIPLAVAGSPRDWRLLEPRHKRAGFLEEAVRELELEHVEVIRATAEDEAQGERRYRIATARALAPPPQAFGLLGPLLDADGTAIVWVGKSAELPPETGLWAEGLATMPGMAHNRKNLD
jgi:16S rRNA (guanine527-N7)-methyltransferase